MTPGSRERILKYSPAGKVPVLIDGEQQVWESLAILEYLAEKFPEAKLWPADARGARPCPRRSRPKCMPAFRPLRSSLPDESVAAGEDAAAAAEVVANVARIEAMWTDCRARFGQSGPFLFGAFGAADAMYAPVVSRFHTYGIDVGAAVRAPIWTR